MTKKLASDPGLRRSSGAGRARLTASVEIGDTPAPNWLHNPACTLARKRLARFKLLYFKQLLPNLRLDCVDAGCFGGRTAILEFFFTRKVAELAKTLAQDVAKRYPPAIANNPVPMVSQQRLSEILEQVFTRATNFSPKDEPGWYKRARLGNAFRWELKEMGYDEKFIDVATESLIAYVTRDPSSMT